MTRTPLSRSKVKVTRPLYSPPCWHVMQLQRWAWERVGREKLLLRCRLLGRARRFGAHGEGRRGAGAYRGGRTPTACLYHTDYRLHEVRSSVKLLLAHAIRWVCPVLKDAFFVDVQRLSTADESCGDKPPKSNRSGLKPPVC